MKPENKALYFSALQYQNRVDQVLCSEELKLQLLAKSSICPGIITIIWSLITSNPTATDADTEEFNSPEDQLRFINEQMKNQWELEKALYLSKLKQLKKTNPLDPENQA